MRNAPALSLTLVPDRRWHRGLGGLGAMAVLVVLVWLGGHVRQAGQAPSAPMLWAAALSVAPALRLLRQAARPGKAGDLVWEPDHGKWSLPTGPGSLDCLADTGDWMLLRHRGPGGRTTWLPVSRTDHAEHWHALRCAVFTPGPPSSPDDE